MRIDRDATAPLTSNPNRHVLAAWVAVQVATATIILVLLASTVPIRPAIALPADVIPDALAIPLGLAFWLVFGLVGGIRARPHVGGGVLTFSGPFIVAGTILGGPLAGALMGLVSEFEVREIRTQPWYGVLANHAVSMLSAVVASVVWTLTGPAVLAVVPGAEPLAFFLAAMATAYTFSGVNVLLIIPTLALRHAIPLREASRLTEVAIRPTALVEAILAWNMAATYVLLGAWAPVVCAALVLLVWQTHDRGEALRRDEKTGLLNDAGLAPRLDAAIAAAATGRRSALLLLDLDGFKAVNDTYLYEAGDEVLVVTARRLLVAVRAMDSVARMNRAGDEFVVLLDGIPDIETAIRLGGRVQAKIREPIRLRSVAATAGVDVSVGVVLLEPGQPMTAADVLALADVRMLRAKRMGSGIVAEGADDEQELAERQAAGPRRRAADARPQDHAPASPVRQGSRD